MSRTIDRQLVCSEAFSWEALPKGALKYVVAGGTIKDLNLRTYAVLNCGFTILHMTRPWSCHFQRRILHAQYAATSLQTLFCCHVATVSAEAVWSAVGTQGYVSVRYAGKKASKSSAPSNLALKNVCEALMQVKRQSSLLEEKMNCNLHGEKLKLFCLVEKQPICVVCQASKLHKTHDCSPIEEAVQDCKVRDVNISMCFPTTL